MLALPVTTWPLSYTKLLPPPFFFWVTMGESLRSSHLIISLKAKSIIIVIISTIWKRLFSRLGYGRRSKTTKARLEVSDATNLGVHLTHLIRKMVKTPTKINTHKLKLIHDGSKRNLCSRRRRMSIWRRRSRSMGSIRQSRLHMWPFSGQLCITPPNRFLADGTHGEKGVGGGMVTCTCERMCVIAEGNMSLSRVAVSW